MMFNMDQPTNEQVQSAAMVLNNAGFNSSSALQIRLDMRDEVRNFQTYLLGQETIMDVDERTGEPIEKIIQIGEPLVNALGYQCMMGWIHSIINKHTIMGNFIDEDWYGNYMSDLHKDVLCDLVVNRKAYGIDQRKLQPILHKYMMSVRLMLTRPIGDKERNGMNNVTKVVENTNTNTMPKNGFMGMMLGGGKK